MQHKRCVIGAGDSIGGFTVGHWARMNGNPAAGQIIGLSGEGADLNVLLYFREAQPVDAPEGALSHRFELSWRTIGSTWADTRTVRPHRKPALPPVHEFGTAPIFVPHGYSLLDEIVMPLSQVQNRYAGLYVVLVQSAPPSGDSKNVRVGVFGWTPEFERWRHGGWYVKNVQYPSGAFGCVSNNYPDKKWRIVCDDRRHELGQPGDFTFPSREAAARAELELVNSLKAT